MTQTADELLTDFRAQLDRTEGLDADELLRRIARRDPAEAQLIAGAIIAMWKRDGIRPEAITPSGWLTTVEQLSGETLDA